MRLIDVEIGLSRPVGGPYLVDLRYTSDEDVDRRLRVEVPVTFDNERLLEAQLDPEGYGQQLGEALFEDKSLWSAFAEARGRSVERDAPLRVRLNIAPNAPELHALRWEMLRDPESGSHLFTGERILFSRYVASFEGERSHLKSKGSLNALVAVANPSDLVEKFGGTLPPINAVREVERARRYLADAEIRCELPSGGLANLNRLLTELRRGVDILYLVCHGQFADQQTWLYLESTEGETSLVSGLEFINELSKIQNRPRLVVLAACESGGKDGGAESGYNALTALGPGLSANAGIGGVVAMQGPVTLETLDAFFSTFFAELQQDGLVDRAMSAARGAIQNQPDWWAPVLFMRLRSGRLWFPQKFAGKLEGEEDESWKSILDNISKDRCTPILGPGLIEPIVGSRRAIARRWAEKFRFPMADYRRDDLPQVAQYLAVKYQLATPRDSLIESVREEILRRFEKKLPDNLEVEEASISALISEVGGLLRKEPGFEPHAALAKLPVSVYVTTNFSNLLADALVEEGKSPRVEWCQWNNDMLYLSKGPDGELFKESIKDREPKYTPTLNEPCVYHLFGHLDEEDSLVLTEDDYFEFLIGSTANKDLIPAFVGRRLTNAGLLFLGYQLEDWNFRVLFRSIMRLPGAALRRQKKLAQVAVQVDPEVGSIVEPDGARDYLKDYFMQAGQIRVYWGSSVQFVEDLSDRWSKRSR